MEMEAAHRHIAPAVDRRQLLFRFPHFPFPHSFTFYLYLFCACFSPFRFCFVLLFHQLYLCVHFSSLLIPPARSVDLCQQPALLLLQFRLLWALLIRVQFLVLLLLLLLPRHTCALFPLEERRIIAAIDADTCKGEEYQSFFLMPPSPTYLGRWAAARRCWLWPTWRCICRLHHPSCLRSTLAGLKRG